jgi:hypothetical protein
MLGLLPGNAEVVVRGRTARIPNAVRQEIDRLKALYDGCHYRELARILLVKVGYPIDDKTVKKLWQQSAVSCQKHWGLWAEITGGIIRDRITMSNGRSGGAWVQGEDMSGNSQGRSWLRVVGTDKRITSQIRRVWVVTGTACSWRARWPLWTAARPELP